MPRSGASPCGSRWRCGERRRPRCRSRRSSSDDSRKAIRAARAGRRDQQHPVVRLQRAHGPVDGRAASARRWSTTCVYRGPGPLDGDKPSWLAIASGAVGVGCAWAAMVAGWKPTLNHVWGWGVVSAMVLSLVPPLGSSDITNYAVYGRLATLGLNPYLGSADSSRIFTIRLVSVTQVSGTTHRRSTVQWRRSGSTPRRC